MFLKDKYNKVNLQILLYWLKCLNMLTHHVNSNNDSKPLKLHQDTHKLFIVVYVNAQ